MKNGCLVIVFMENGLIINVVMSKLFKFNDDLVIID